jgi:hypothetical protein
MRFSRKELFPPENGKTFSNECGDSDGCSVLRATELTDAEIQARSELQAAVRPNRESDGAVLANAATLRDIEIEGRVGEKLVFIYDDPKKEDQLHAVLRGSQKLDRPEQTLLRDAIEAAFTTELSAELRIGKVAIAPVNNRGT